AAGLRIRCEFEALPSGVVRGRHTVTNHGSTSYVVDAMDVAVPVPDRVTEVLDLTGRWGMERQPQRHPVADGLWMRENRRGRTGHDAATPLAAGPPGCGSAQRDGGGVP